ncbi:hypothetical protein [Breoghania sp.]|uniref:hypothetical protein n=1 Tax=Breoghania sp. TaxID=2065378 RepID=UPI0026249389|nr:hypothetical protein [Breoghania sp.]MDJ0933546.1 hypothetical protein [Breoghania sp.]
MKSDSVLMWEFPQAFIACFPEVFILIYLFEGSPMSAWLKAAKLSYQTMAVQDGRLVSPIEVDESALKAALREPRHHVRC